MLLTRSPLSPRPKPGFSLDLHVLSAPPAFVLSQDQTLREDGLPSEEGKLFTSSLCSKLSPSFESGVPARPANLFHGIASDASDGDGFLRPHARRHEVSAYSHC